MKRAASFALAALCALQLLCLLRAPAAFSPANITVRLAPGQALVLGRQELAAPAAGSSHLGLRRDHSGKWMVQNAGSGRGLVLARGDRQQRIGTTTLQAGQRFHLGASVFAIETADDGQVSFTDGGHRWRYDGATLARDGQPQGACPDTGPGARVQALWNRLAPSALTVALPLAFGGNLHCGNQIGVALADPASAAIVLGDDGLLLSSTGQAPVLLLAPTGPVDLARREEPLDGVDALVAGRTRLRLAIDGDTLRLQPMNHVALFAQPRADLPPEVAWDWKRRAAWSIRVPQSWMLAAIAALLAAAWSGWHASRAAAAGARWAAFAMGAAGIAIAFAGIAGLALQRSHMAPGPGISLLVAWAALWYTLLAPRRTALVTCAAVLLLAAGLLAQLEMGLGATDSAWLQHFQKTSFLLACGLGLGTRLAALRLSKPVAQARLEWLLLACAALALLALLLQVAYGGETGVFGLQPVEFAKLALTALAAHCLALGASVRQDGGTLLRWLRPAAPAVLFVVLLGVALVQVDDYSPLVLLAVWGAAMLLAWSLASGRRAATATLAGAACAVVLGVAGLRSAEAAQLANVGFYADRFMVWLDPAAHPHTGQQMLLAARAVADGGWRGADGFFGISTLGQAAGEVLRIPAVQDDFAPSFFLNRHGLAAGLALWALQALFIVALLHLSARMWMAAGQARDFRHAWLARFRCFVLCGGAAFVSGHFLLSWGTNLAIFPIMGQPMSFLSAGGSHLLFFICPLLAVGSASAQSLEESQTCRSMSNMKP